MSQAACALKIIKNMGARAAGDTSEGMIGAMVNGLIDKDVTEQYLYRRTEIDVVLIRDAEEADLWLVEALKAKEHNKPMPPKPWRQVPLNKSNEASLPEDELDRVARQ